MARAVKGLALTIGGAYSGAAAWSVLDHNPLEVPVPLSLLQTTMWMPDAPLRLLLGSQLTVPTTESALADPVTVTTCLNKGQALPVGGRVDEVTVEQFGKNNAGHAKGLMSRVYRVHCTYDPAGPAGPSSFIAKLPSLDFTARFLGRLFLGENETNAYIQGVPQDSGIAAPACFYAEYDRISGDAALFLEDLTPRSTVDQVTGWTVDEAILVTHKIAKMHAAFWDRCVEAPSLQGWRFTSFAMPTLLETGRQMFADKALSTPRVIHEALDYQVSQYYQDLLAMVNAKADVYFGSGCFLGDRPMTLQHGDVRTENVFLPSSPGDPMYLIDWQVLTEGPGAYDVAYIVCLSMTGEDSDTESEELDVMIEYYNSLKRHLGSVAEDYSFTQFAYDYQLAVLVLLVKLSCFGDEAKEVWQRNRPAVARMYSRLDQAVQRWNLQQSFSAGLLRAGTDTAPAVHLNEDEMFDILPPHIQRYIESTSNNAAPKAAVGLSSDVENVSLGWRAWLASWVGLS